MQLQATLDLLGRTARTFRHVWSQRATLDGTPRQFLGGFAQQV